jgi:hypothetical protein
MISYIKICFKNSELDFFTSIENLTEEEIKEDLIGTTFDFSFKNRGRETCINVVFQENNKHLNLPD